MEEDNKRIMIISDHADPLAVIGGLEAGGQNIYVLELAKNLTKFNWRVDVFTRWDNPRKKQINWINRKARVIRIKAGPIKRIPRDEIFQHLAEFTENIVKFKSQTNNNYCLIHSNYWMSGWISLRLKKIYNIPLIQLFHSLGRIKYHALQNTDTQKMSSGYFTSDFMKNRLRVEQELFDNADVVLASSPVEKKDMLKHYQANNANIKIIPLGIDPKAFKPINQMQARQHINWPTEQKIILYVGRIEWRKGLGTLLYALGNLLTKKSFQPDELSLKIVGGHPRSRAHNAEYYEFQHLRKIISELKLENYVRFLGLIKREKLPYYYSAANLLIAPSYYEPFGLVPVEAMACAAPVIGSRVGGIKFTVKNQKTGFLVPARRYRALANKMLVLLNSPDLQTSMGQEAVSRVKSNFNNNILIRELNNLFKTIINKTKL
ncbi:MAG: glycosyltransferase [bacterium]